MATFPKLGILWSRDEAHSARILLRLKKGTGLYKPLPRDTLLEKGLIRRSLKAKK